LLLLSGIGALVALANGNTETAAGLGFITGINVVLLVGSYIHAYLERARLIEEQRKAYLEALQKHRAEMNDERLAQEKVQGLPNTEVVLVKKARIVAPALLDCVLKSTAILFDRRQDRDEKEGAAFNEMAFYGLHYVQRLVLAYWGLEEGRMFTHALAMEAAEFLSRGYETALEASAFRSPFLETFLERDNEYLGYHIYSKGENELAGSLNWEFGKKMSLLLESRLNPAASFSAQTTALMLQLQLQKLLEALGFIQVP